MNIRIVLDIVPEYISWTEWRAVYEECLILLKQYPFMDLIRSDIYGKHFYACTRTKNRKIKNENMGFSIWGDMTSRKLGGRFYVPGILNRNGCKDERGNGDIFLTLLPGDLGQTIGKQEPKVQRIWDSDTKGYPYTLYLLAIGCLIEARLPEAAVIWGDITGSQCRKAICWANQYLDMPIELSDRASPENLYKRIEKMGFIGESAGKVFQCLSIESFGEEYLEVCSQKLPVFDMSGEPTHQVIDTAQDLMCYKTGDRISPQLDKELRHKADFIRKVGGEDYDKNFLGLGKKGRILFMTRAAGRFLMSLDFWTEVFSRCLDDNFMRKIYPIARIGVDELNGKQMYYALFLNDELRKRYE